MCGVLGMAVRGVVRECVLTANCSQRATLPVAQYTHPSLPPSLLPPSPSPSPKHTQHSSTGEEASLRRRLSALESRRSCLEAAAGLTAALAGGRGGGGVGAAAAAAVVGGGSSIGSSASLLDGVSRVMLQLRELLENEEQQQRLLLAERRQLKRGRGSGEGEEGGEDEYELEGEDEMEEEDEDEEVTSSAAGVSALRAALDELEGVEEGLREAQAQVNE